MDKCNMVKGVIIKYGNTITSIFKDAVLMVNERRVNNTSNNNIALDIRDNLTESFELFTKDHPEIVFSRVGLKMELVIQGNKINIKCHNSLSKKYKKQNITEGQQRMDIPVEYLNDAELELAYTTSRDRRLLMSLAIVDYGSKISTQIYTYKKSEEEKNTENELGNRNSINGIPNEELEVEKNTIKKRQA